MEKVIQDGKVAVLVTPEYGAGWYSWHRIEALLYDPQVVELVQDLGNIDDNIEYMGVVNRINDYCEQTYGDDYKYSGCFGAVGNLEIVWVDEGQEFRVVEFDGSEHLEFPQNVRWIRA